MSNVCWDGQVKKNLNKQKYDIYTHKLTYNMGHYNLHIEREFEKTHKKTGIIYGKLNETEEQTEDKRGFIQRSRMSENKCQRGLLASKVGLFDFRIFREYTDFGKLFEISSSW